MPDRFIPLKCQSCGAKLEVYDDMNRFACGYCGTEMLVERRGGTVSLKAVEQAIQKVQIGTDKTAAELALARLNEELKALTARRTEVESGREDNQGCYITVAAISGFGGLVLLFSGMSGDSSSGGAFSLGLLMTVGSIAFIVLAWSGRGEKKEKLNELDLRIQEVKRQVEEKMRIAEA